MYSVFLQNRTVIIQNENVANEAFYIPSGHFRFNGNIGKSFLLKDIENKFELNLNYEDATDQPGGAPFNNYQNFKAHLLTLST